MNVLQEHFEKASNVAEVWLRTHHPDLIRANVAGFEGAWEILLRLEGTEIPVYIGLLSGFPCVPPKVRVKEPDRFWLRVPHIEKDGTLCLYTNAAATKADSPIEAVEDVIRRAGQLLGKPNPDDFFDEFYSYWQTTRGDASRLLLITPDGELAEQMSAYLESSPAVVAAEETALRSWCTNAGRSAPKESLLHNVIRIDIAQRVLPQDFPKNVRELIELIGPSLPDVSLDIARHVARSYEPYVVLLRFPAGKGTIDAAVKVTGQRVSESEVVQKGFRKGHVPEHIMLARAYKEIANTKIERLGLQPVHHNYIHSRGGNGVDFSARSVIVAGCGSLGGYVAHFLAKAGVGHLILIDDETLSWENIGRHILGADAVGKSKAKALADTIQKEMPHLNVESRNSPIDAQFVTDTMYKCDLLVSCIGTWHSERRINLWARKTSGAPPVIFGWVESHAVAGHALFVHQRFGGCLRCGCDSWGEFEGRVTQSDDMALQKGAGCSGFYQPYGVIESLPAATMIAQLAADALLGLCISSELRTWVGPQSIFDTHNKTIRDQWKAIVRRNPHGGYHYGEWPVNMACPDCN